MTRLSRSMKVLLVGIFGFHAGWYMLLPFFTVLFTSRRGLSPAEAGSVLAIQSFALLLGAVAGGVVADQYGRRLAMVGGLFLRGAGIMLLGLAAGLPSSLLAAAVAGFGGGLFGPAAKSAIAIMATEADRATVFSLRGIAANIGTTAGPLLGALLVGGPMPLLFGIAAILHVAMGIGTWAMLPAETDGAREKEPWRDMLQDMPFMLFSGVTVLAWALFAQLAVAVPLHAQQVLGLEAGIGLIWTFTSLTVIALQLPVSRHVLARLHPMTAMTFGAILLGGGLGLVGLTRSFPGLLGALLVFIVGEMLLMPTVDTATARLSSRENVGSYFGIATLSWGLGEGIGSLVGGGLMQAAQAGLVWLPWVTYAGVGLAVGGLYWALRRWHTLRTQMQPKPVIHLMRPGFPVPDEAVRLGGNPDEE